jgi:hypothetical protein
MIKSKLKYDKIGQLVVVVVDADIDAAAVMN